MDLDQPSPPYNTVRGKMQKRSAAAELARKQNHVFVHGTEVGRGGGGIIVGERGCGGKEGGERSRAEIQLRSIDRLRSRQISARCEIRRLVSLASRSRGLLASDTFDSSNRFVIQRQRPRCAAPATHSRQFQQICFQETRESPNRALIGCPDNDRFDGEGKRIRSSAK